MGADPYRVAGEGVRVDPWPDNQKVAKDWAVINV